MREQRAAVGAGVCARSRVAGGLSCGLQFEDLVAAGGGAGDLGAPARGRSGDVGARAEGPVDARLEAGGALGRTREPSGEVSVVPGGRWASTQAFVLTFAASGPSVRSAVWVRALRLRAREEPQLWEHENTFRWVCFRDGTL